MAKGLTVSRPLSAGSRERRRGVATLWLILLLPVLVILLGFVLEIANLWLARGELENAMEAAALAAVTEWGSTNDPVAARNRGVDFAATNSVRGFPVSTGTYGSFTTNLGAPGDINGNASCSATPISNTVPYPNLIFGAVDRNTLQFCANTQPSCGGANIRIVASGGFGSTTGRLRILFDESVNTDPNLVITSVRIDIVPLASQACPPPNSSSRFALASGNDPEITARGTVSTATPGSTVASSLALSPTKVPFLVTPGFTACASGMSVDDSHYATFNFSYTTTTSEAFNPDDYIEFSLKTSKLKPGAGTDDGDDFGLVGVTATVTFRKTNDAGFLQTVTAVPFNQCDPGAVTPPTPPTCNVSDGISTARLSGGANSAIFAVRAQAKWTAPGGLGGWLSGVLDHRIHAEATAVYDCSDTIRCPRLIRIGTFNCNCP